MSVPAFDLGRLDATHVVEVDLADEAIRQDFVRVCSEWSRRPPFYAVNAGTVQVICSRFVDVMELYQDRERFSVEVPVKPGYERFDKFMGVRGLPQIDGAKHDRIRRLVNPAFTPAAMQRFEPQIESVVAELLDAIAAGPAEFDAMRDFSLPMMPRILLDRMFKVAERQKRAFLGISAVIPLATYIKPGQPYPDEYMAAFAEVRASIDELIAQRRANPGEDWISSMIALRDGQDLLSDVELFDLIFTLCGAALQSTASSMGSVLLNLHRNPDQLALLRAEPNLTGQAIDECLRYQGAGIFTFPRFALADTEIGGTKIMKGMTVRACGQAACLDEEQYPNALQVDIRRNARSAPSFGAGMHHCIGSWLARRVLRIGLTSMLERFPKLRLTDPNFRPRYRGQVGETQIEVLPMRVD